VSRSLTPRRVLGIETSTAAACSVALAEDGRVIASARLPADARPTARLVPAIGELCRGAGWSVRQLDLVCVDIGPGSYTGLRVGLTCAKALAFATDAGLATAESLAVVARNAPANERLVEVAFDAARGQVFAARSARQGDNWLALAETRILNANEWARSLDPAALVLGPALTKYRSLISSPQRVADESDWSPRVERVIEIALAQFQVEPLTSFWTLEPLYLRPSAAEEKLQDRHP